VNGFLVFGLGYTGRAITMLARDAGFAVAVTSRDAAAQLPEGVTVVPFEAAGEVIARATHIVSTAPVDHGRDPVLARWRDQLAASKDLRWAGYLSTTSVYGDHAGGWVDEDTPPTPSGPRGAARLAAEREWVAALAGRCATDLFRVAGIYGPGRSALDDVRSGRARRIDKPGHAFGRIHRDDIAEAVIAAARQDRPPGFRVLNLNDDEPAESAIVTAEAARLLGAPLPPLVPFDQAFGTMGEMARSFWSESRRVASRKTQAALAHHWRYPTFREGLAAILAAERADAEQAADQPGQQRDVGRP